jgi:vacuolar-type H+-ATPase subunit F/Vma7
MAAPVYLGDEATGAGFRLAGADSRFPAPGDEAAALALARRDAPVVLVSAAVAARIPGEVLRAALRAVPPVTVIVPDLREGFAFADDSARLRRQLGLEG